MEYKVFNQIGENFRAVDLEGKSFNMSNIRGMRGGGMVQLKDGTILAAQGVMFDSQLDEAKSTGGCSASTDGGKTWGPLQIGRSGGLVYDEVNDTLVILKRQLKWKPGMEQGELIPEWDHIQGKVNEFFTVSKSTDGGITWTEPTPVEIKGLPAEWNIKNCPTPNRGIQLKYQKDSSKNGRLVIPCNDAALNANGINEFRAHLIYSDDGGDTWQVGARQELLGANESIAVELRDGTLLVNCRNQGGEPRNLRIQGRSYDGGETYADGTSVYVDSLYDPICHGGFATAIVDNREYIFCSLPAGAIQPESDCFGNMINWGRRELLTLYISTDNGYTYLPLRRITEPDHFTAYSHLLVTQEGKLLIIWESGPKLNDYSWLEYTEYDLKELVKGL